MIWNGATEIDHQNARTSVDTEVSNTRNVEDGHAVGEEIGNKKSRVG